LANKSVNIEYFKKYTKFNSSDGSIELLKWLALALMTVDHINKYLFNGTIEIMFNVGRLAMPIFLYVLIFNLARPGQTNNINKRLISRVFIFGVMATIPYIALSGRILPLNILFTLLSLILIINLLDNKKIILAFIATAVFGYFVEFSWAAMVLGISIWVYIKTKNPLSAIFVILSCASLYFINGNFWALASLPLIAVVSEFKIKIPKYKWVFYIFYPSHLFALWLIRIPMSNAGYLFF